MLLKILSLTNLLQNRIIIYMIFNLRKILMKKKQSLLNNKENQKLLLEKDAFLSAREYSDQEKILIELIFDNIAYPPDKKRKILIQIKNNTLNTDKIQKLIKVFDDSNDAIDALVEEIKFKRKEELVKNTDIAKIKWKIWKIKSKLAMFKIHYKEAKEIWSVDENTKLEIALNNL